VILNGVKPYPDEIAIADVKLLYLLHQLDWHIVSGDIRGK